MNILILGSGGREHALAWKIRQSSLCDTLFVAPGNAGTAEVATNLSIPADDFEGIKSAVLENSIGLVVVGPEDPLAKGIRNYFSQEAELMNIPLLGPSAKGALLESSKDFAKAFMQRHNIPTATYRTFTKMDREEAEGYIALHPLPIVMKADGLAAGKGVVICQTGIEALQFLEEVWDSDKFGEAGHKVVIEQFLSGIEVSVFALTDGHNYVILPEAKDYKRIGEGDTGPNTGGMGTVSPVPFAGEAFMKKVEEKIIKPSVAGLASEDLDFRGFLFAGLMNVDGEPYVIEYNVRMGDPETQVVIPRLDEDIVPLLLDAATGNLRNRPLKIKPETTVAVIAVSGGYPDAYKKGYPISGLDSVGTCLVFHAGTTVNEGQIQTAGGRVLAVVGMADSISAARESSYNAMKNLTYKDMYLRGDIGLDLI